MKDITDFMFRNRQFFAFVSILVIVSLALFYFQTEHEDSLQNNQDKTTERLNKAALASCERGNTIREVVYANTIAIKTIANNPNPPNDSAAKYRKQISTLRSAPFVNLLDGTVDCEKAVSNPNPDDS